MMINKTKQTKKSKASAYVKYQMKVYAEFCDPSLTGLWGGVRYDRPAVEVCASTQRECHILSFKPEIEFKVKMTFILTIALSIKDNKMNS